MTAPDPADISAAWEAIETEHPSETARKVESLLNATRTRAHLSAAWMDFRQGYLLGVAAAQAAAHRQAVAEPDEADETHG